jgi:accessory colonization factor AcfC
VVGLKVHWVESLLRPGPTIVLSSSHGLANIEPIALQARLSLREESIEAVDRVTKEILAVCQPE